MIWTKQKIFTKVKNHLLKQKEKAVDLSEGGCRYRWGGLACAAGCLIPNKEYDPRIEGLPFTSTKTTQDRPGCRDDRIFFNKLQKRLGLYKFRMFIYELQQIHDNFDVNEWATQLYDFAEELKLKFD